MIADSTLKNSPPGGRMHFDALHNEESHHTVTSPFQRLADDVPALMWMCDASKACTWFNRAWLEFVGRAMDEEVGDGWTTNVHPEDVERCWELFVRYFEARQPFTMEYRLKRWDGQWRWMLDQGAPTFGASGAFSGYIGSCVDITERHEAEAALRAAKEAAEAASLAKDRFLAALSHELRTPLTPVLMAAAAMEQNGDLPAGIRHEMAMIRRNVELETKLIDDLLDLNRVAIGKLQLHIEPVDVNRAVRDVCEMCGRAIEAKQIQLNCIFDDGIGTIWADGARLRQVLWNVLKNAAKFTPMKGRIEISTQRAGGGRARVVVLDTGIGIAPELLRRIFVAMEQGGDAVTREFGGLGLGLAISKSIVELHGGTIQARSEGPNRGAEFTIELPGDRPATVEDGSCAPNPAQGRSDTMRLLLVEDHSDTVRLMAKLLEKSGYVTRTAGSAAEALEHAAREPFDFVISDIGLPDASGYSLMAEIRKIQPAKGIAMSGYGMEEDVKKSKEAGFSEHLVKPIDIGRLEEAIRRLS